MYGQALRVCLEKFLQQTETLAMNGDNSFHHLHHQVLLRQRIEALGRAVSELQVSISVCMVSTHYNERKEALYVCSPVIRVSQIRHARRR